MIEAIECRRVICLVALLWATCGLATGQDDGGSTSESAAEATPVAATGAESSLPTLEELKTAGALKSSYRKHQQRPADTQAPQPQLAAFRKTVEPVLKKTCVQCHGPDTQEGHIRIDTLDPDLLHGKDVSWWIEILGVLNNGEMPPPDDVEFAESDRSKVVEWLSSEIQVASTVRRAEQGHSSFRRMTRYEYNDALQDLLGLPYDFAKDLPPESTSEDGFQNSSELLHMSVVQFETYRELGLKALKTATVRGERPAPFYWGISMDAASADLRTKYDKEVAKIKREHKDDPEKQQQQLDRLAARHRDRPNNVYYKDLETGLAMKAVWNYGGAKYAWKPRETRPEVPPVSQHVAIIPPGKKLIVELGDRVPEEGTLRIRVRASRTSDNQNHSPSLQLEFGWQASNDSQASVRISNYDVAVDAPPDQPKFYQWEIPLTEIYPRNSVRHISHLGDLPSPSEYIKIVNSSVSEGDVQLDYVEIAAPVYDQWPPESHTGIFIDSKHKTDEAVYAREVLTNFMSRAWRRRVTASDVDQKLKLFATIRPQCDDFQEAVIEVLATVISSPKFLYLVQADPDNAESPLTPDELATRLSMFLWCSIPDDELWELAAAGQLTNHDVLTRQVDRMLADSRSRRFSKQFVRQWLGMQLLDYLNVDRKAYPQFDPSLKEAMQQEPVAFFQEVLQHNYSVLDFIHADYTMVNERLARHYGLSGVYGNDFRRVTLNSQDKRGGLLTEAGLLAMNSDGKDSHPLKRGIWMLKSLLNDPPPPPPPAVPKIDLADPEIAKLTLKQRIENHRNQAACRSCHSKIDPWGIAFENFDAVGNWRTDIQGKPVDASSLLFNGQRLDGMNGLKRFLLEHRQDQFIRALVYKMTTFALGRPLTFGDRSSIDQITADLRHQGDGLVTMVKLIVASDLFQSK